MNSTGQGNEIARFIQHAEFPRFPIGAEEVQVHSMNQFFSVSLGNYYGGNLAEKVAHRDNPRQEKLPGIKVLALTQSNRRLNRKFAAASPPQTDEWAPQP